MKWAEALARLAEQVVTWVEDTHTRQGVMVEHEQELVPIADEPLVTIVVDGKNRLRLEPAGFAENIVPTVVHLYAYPSLRRVRLVGPEDDGSWRIQSREGVDMNYDWSPESLFKLIDALADEPIPKAI